MSSFGRISLILLCLLCSGSLRAQHIPDDLLGDVAAENKKSESMAKPACEGTNIWRFLASHPSQIQRRSYDVLSYNLLMDWRLPLSSDGPAARRYWGLNSISLQIDSAVVSSIELDAQQLSIDSVLLDGVMLKSAIMQVGDLASIQLPRSYSKGEKFVLDVYYTQKSTANQPGFFGFANIPVGQYGNNPLDTVWEKLAYTMSEPEGARSWMPCNDRPYDKARANITVIVPKGYNVCSNGPLLVHRENLGEDKHESYAYGDTTLIPTYLMVVAASKFSQYDGIPYRRISDTTQKVPAPVYCWQRDSIIYADNLQWMQNSTVQMMERHSFYYGEYPFSKYGQTLLFPFFSGSMEHQSNTTHHRRCLTDRWESVVAHELMHQWTGDKVTCATWGDIWLNEGGATFGEFLWIEHTQGVEAARVDFRARRDKAYFRSDSAFSQPPIYGISLDNLFNNGTTYVKGGWVYYMLRTLLGDSTYFSVMKKYFDHFAYQSIETEDMLHFFESQVPNPRVSFRTFFDQWLYSAGHPYYSAQLQSVTKNASGYTIGVRFNQRVINPGSPSLFVMPVTLRFHDNYSAGTFDYTFINDSAEQTLQIQVPFLPRSFVIDEDQTILCMRDAQDISVSVEDSEELNSTQLAILPNPVQSAQDLRVQYKVEHAAPVRIDLFDAQGRSIRELHNAWMDDGKYEARCSTADLSNGSYALRLSVGEKFIFSTFIVAH